MTSAEGERDGEFQKKKMRLFFLVFFFVTTAAVLLFLQNQKTATAVLLRIVAEIENFYNHQLIRYLCAYHTTARFAVLQSRSLSATRCTALPLCAAMDILYQPSKGRCCIATKVKANGHGSINSNDSSLSPLHTLGIRCR